MSCSTSTLQLFGGQKPWSPLDWTSSDDRVRGGASQSYLDTTPSSQVATFRGTLDIKTLGGAGFASQRTTGEDRSWDLSSYDGLSLDIEKSDGKRYTLTLKDSLLPQSPDGREQSTVSWEYDFEPASSAQSVFVQWSEFNATYRGREQKDAPPLDLKHVKRFSLMMRSFFGTQEGNFSLSLVSISATKNSQLQERYRDDPHSEEVVEHTHEKEKLHPQEQGWLSWLYGCIVS